MNPSYPSEGELCHVFLPGGRTPFHHPVSKKEEKGMMKKDVTFRMSKR